MSLRARVSVRLTRVYIEEVEDESRGGERQPGVTPQDGEAAQSMSPRRPRICMSGGWSGSVALHLSLSASPLSCVASSSVPRVLVGRHMHVVLMEVCKRQQAAAHGMATTDASSTLTLPWAHAASTHLHRHVDAVSLSVLLCVVASPPPCAAPASSSCAPAPPCPCRPPLHPPHLRRLRSRCRLPPSSHVCTR